MFVKKKALEACTITSLLYNAETWADARFEYLEVTYRRMLKSILCVGMTVCNEFVYIELGMISMKTRVMMMQWKFWKNLTEMNDDNPLAYVIKEAKKYKLKEIRHYEKLVQSFASVEEIISKFYEDLRNSIRRKAESGRSKYITYLEINPTLETPKVYDSLRRHKTISIWETSHIITHSSNRNGTQN